MLNRSHPLQRLPKFRASLLCLTSLAALAVLTASSCASNPVASASRPETVALALYGSFVIVEEAAADLNDSPNVSATIKAQLKAADAKASPVAEKLRPLAADVQKARADVAAATTTAAKLTAAIAAAQAGIDDAAPLISALTDLVKGAKQ